MELAIRLLRIALVETSQPYAKPSHRLLARLAADEAYRRGRRRVGRGRRTGKKSSVGGGP